MGKEASREQVIGESRRLDVYFLFRGIDRVFSPSENVESRIRIVRVSVNLCESKSERVKKAKRKGVEKVRKGCNGVCVRACVCV